MNGNSPWIGRIYVVEMLYLSADIQTLWGKSNSEQNFSGILFLEIKIS